MVSKERIYTGIVFLILSVICVFLIWGLATDWKFIFKDQSNIGSFKSLYTKKDLTTDLNRDSSWYDQYKNQTYNYLKNVYPNGSFENLSALELAQIYNSLYYYYSPCTGNSTLTDAPFYDLGLYSKSNWADELCQNIRLPYPPIGTFFDWYEYAQNNIPYTFSTGDKINDKTRSINTLISSQPTLPWGMWGCNSQGSFCSEKNQRYRSGPGPFWVTSYSWVRNIHYPHGIYNDNNTWKVNNYPIDKINQLYQLTAKEGEYIEVTHSGSGPGMVQSQGYWFNSMPYGGSGVFYKVGKTKIANNKMAMLFSLLSEILTKNSKDLQLPNLKNIDLDVSEKYKQDYSNMSGSDLINYWYGTTDIYKIIWKYAGCSAENYNLKSGSDYDPNSDNVWGPMPIAGDGIPLLNLVDGWYLLDNGRGVTAVSGLINPTGLTVNDDHKNIKYEDFNWRNIGKSKEYTLNNTCDFATLARYHLKKDNLNYNDKKNAIDTCMNNDFYLSRVCTSVSWDEPNFWAANILGYVTLQMPNSPNSSGYIQGEMIHTLVPKNHQDFIKGRIYANTKTNNNLPYYTKEYLFEIGQDITNYLSSRDPINVNDDTKASKCPLGWFGQGGETTSCQNKAQYAKCSPVWCLNNDNNQACYTNGFYDNCTGNNTATFPDNLFMGQLDNNGKCYPNYNNIYCPKSLSSLYNQIMIANGLNNVVYNTRFCENTGGKFTGNAGSKYCDYRTEEQKIMEQTVIDKRLEQTDEDAKFIMFAGNK